jgi:hypothetical protein
MRKLIATAAWRTLARAERQLDDLRTPEGAAIPKNARRDMDRLQVVKRQVNEIEKTRAKRLSKEPSERRDAMVRLQPEATGAVMQVTKWLKPSG